MSAHVGDAEDPFHGVTLFNDKAIFTPYDANIVGILGLQSRVFTSVDISDKITGPKKFRGGAIMGNNIYFAPYYAQQIGVFNIIQGTFSLIDLESACPATTCLCAPSCDLHFADSYFNEPVSAGKFNNHGNFGSVSVIDEHVYIFPIGAKQVLRYTPADNSLTVVAETPPNSARNTGHTINFGSQTIARVSGHRDCNGFDEAGFSMEYDNLIEFIINEDFENWPDGTCNIPDGTDITNRIISFIEPEQSGYTPLSTLADGDIDRLRGPGFGGIVNWNDKVVYTSNHEGPAPSRATFKNQVASSTSLEKLTCKTTFSEPRIDNPPSGLNPDPNPVPNLQLGLGTHMSQHVRDGGSQTILKFSWTDVEASYAPRYARLQAVQGWSSRDMLDLAYRSITDAMIDRSNVNGKADFFVVKVQSDDPFFEDDDVILYFLTIYNSTNPDYSFSLTPYMDFHKDTSLAISGPGFFYTNREANVNGQRNGWIKVNYDDVHPQYIDLAHPGLGLGIDLCETGFSVPTKMSNKLIIPPLHNDHFMIWDILEDIRALW